MKIKHKKLLISGTAAAMAGILGVGAFLQTSVSVKASAAMMPGIETIVKNATKEKPFRILELVDNSEDAEIGYYISGQEPSVLLYEYQYTDTEGTVQKIHFSNLEDGLSKLPEKYRKEFAMNVKLNDDGSVDENASTGIKKISSVSNTSGDGNTETAPLSYIDYQEKYFLDQGESEENGWNKISLKNFDGSSRTDTVTLSGSYVENSSGNGDYTKEQQEYYPVRKDVEADNTRPEKYRENIQNFYFSEGDDSRGAYFLQFEEVDNTTVNNALKDENDKGQATILPEYDYSSGKYGYYENVYTDLTEEIVENIRKNLFTFPGENPGDVSQDANAVLIQDNTVTQSGKNLENDFNDGMGNDSQDQVETPDTTGNFESENTGTENPADDFGSGETGTIEDTSEDESADGEFSENADVPAGNMEDGFDGAEGTEGDSEDESFDNGEEVAAPETGETADIGNEADDNFGSNNSETMNPETMNPEITDPETAETGDVTLDDGSGQTEDSTVSGNTGESTGRKILGQVQDGPTAGSQSNPFVYLGQTIEQYPFYKYTLIGDLAYVDSVAKANGAKDAQTVEDGETVVRLEGDITIADGQYWYWTDDGLGNITRLAVSVVTGRQPVSYSDIRQIPEDFDYDYYYKVEKVYFCCVKKADGSETDPSAYTSFGWYYPSYPDNEDVYIRVNDGDGKIATHYISDAMYSLTPENGNYDFVPGDGENCQVQVEHFYYKGGYSNNDWLKRYVFHLTPGDGEFEKLSIKVDTRTAADLQEIYAVQTGSDQATQSGEFTVEDVNAGSASADITDGESTGSEDTDAETLTEENELETLTEEGEIAENLSEENKAPEPVAQDADQGSAQEFSSDLSETDEISSEENKEDLSDGGETDGEALTDGESGDVFEDGSGDGASAKTTAKSSILDEYDLIYINGTLSSETAELFKDSTVPCIVNTSRLTEGSVLEETFNGFIRDSDSDGHYVNRYMYFFKNTLQPENGESLVNTAFHTSFNTGDSGTVTDDPTEGFEEILSYIKSENKYRALGNSDDSGEDGVTDGENAKLDPLSTELSQARALEYIINYQYKRNQKTKTDINVLEIEPYKCSSQISEGVVKNWIDGSSDSLIQDVKVCCYHKGDGEPEKMLDGNSGTMWHSAYTSGGENYYDSSITNGPNHAESTDSNKHWIEVTLTEPKEVTGFLYQPRNDNYRNGILNDYTVEMWDESGNKTGTKSGNTGLTQNSDSSRKEYSFGQTFKGVKKIRLTFNTTLAHDTNNNNKYASCAEFGIVTADTRNVTVTTMTAAEFVGHKDDIASEYDMIYIGDYNQKRDDLVNGKSPLLYAHVGAAVSVAQNLKTSNRADGDFSRLLGQLDNEYDITWPGNSSYKKRFAPVSSYSEDGAGYFRGSGNDITKQQCQELTEFVKSGYPVILGNGIVSSDGSSRRVNESTVDASSWYYQFMKTALQYDNVVTRSEAENQGKLNSFFVDLAKPVIRFAENGRPSEPKRLNENTTEGRGYIENNELKYTFTVENDSDAAPAVSTYDCKLYFDLNFDGNLSKNEVQDKYVTITDSSGNVLTQVSYGDDDMRYELKLGEQYTVTRKIPAEYFKLITWKLVVSSNTNSNIYTSEMGYAKQANQGERQPLNVLQIIPDNGGKWNLKTDTNFQNQLKKVEDFDITIDVMTVSQYAQWGESAESRLNNYQILIIGFDDVYQNIPNDKGQVEAIRNYIRSGRSVIFSHDTTSYLSYEYGKGYSDVYPQIAETEYGVDEKYAVHWDSWLNNTYNNPGWGISLNSILRSVVGMDRYGIVSDETIGDNTTISSLLKQGHELNSEGTIQSVVGYTGDAAYKAGDENRSSTYAQTQAFANGTLRNYNLGGKTTNRATKVNDGAITEYPYRISDTMQIATTHGQYYQLALEQDWDNNGRSDGDTDIVVWYCLTDNIYSDSPNDARNYYYYYSRGNVIYTGTGHWPVGNNIDEIQLFINSIVAAANVSQASPDVSFVKTLNPSADMESVHYYMTDQSSWTQGEANTLEANMDLYINIKDYNMVSADLNQEDLDKQEMTMQFFIESEDGETVSNEDVKLNSELSGKKLEDITGKIGSLREYGSDNTLSVSSDGKFHTSQNNAYGFTVPDIEKYLRNSGGLQDYRSSCKVYVKLSSTVYLYGEPKTSTVWAGVDLKQRQLFDLD